MYDKDLSRRLVGQTNVIRVLLLVYVDRGARRELEVDSVDTRRQANPVQERQQRLLVAETKQVDSPKLSKEERRHQLVDPDAGSVADNRQTSSRHNADTRSLEGTNE